MVAIVLAQRFPLMSLACCLESLRIANREAGKISFTRTILTADDGPATSSSGIPLTPDAILSDVRFAPIVLVLSSYRPEEACQPLFLGWLRKQYRRGAIVGCVDTASYILAQANILGAHKVAAHRETLSSYREILKSVALLDQLVAADDRIVSSAGGVATLDMMLGVISRFSGKALAERVAYVLNYRPLAADAKSAETSPEGTIARVERRLARLIELMQSHLETPIDVATICRMAHVPPATAHRLFHRYFDTSPSRYYTKLRLERAQWLLGNSALPISEVAAKVGFEDASAFARAFRRMFGSLPSSFRRHGNEPEIIGSHKVERYRAMRCSAETTPKSTP
ncbi:helix-turn-helix domain-containing protein [Mesorhizobium sp. DCY119]|uniref:GlxA family transcriptional regulator n=1 Tax=Mesorhizobium sp. DCY119 TaxID=2108445 RepID=UPI00140417F2|nr:helix-turn-helix domain-containing protein [Mesorhizobium sp. DCY119]